MPSLIWVSEAEWKLSSPGSVRIRTIRMYILTGVCSPIKIVKQLEITIIKYVSYVWVIEKISISHGKDSA